VIRLRLRTRLTVWFAASILLILAPFLTGILVLQWRAMRAALDHHLEEDLEVASEMLVVHRVGIGWRTDAEHDLGYDDGPQRWVEVYAPNGPVLFLRGFPRREAIRSALAAPSSDSVGYRTVRTPAGAFVRTLTAGRRLASTPVWIRVARSEDTLRRDLRGLAWLFALAAPVAVMAAALVGYVIAGRALAPLARMADRARSIGADQLSERLPVENTRDEMGQLALVFNDTFARLEASFERLKQFTADASHELRTPLTAIRSVGEVGLREPRDARAYQEIIGSMLEETDHLARVVDTLLTLSRWESGRARPARQELDLHALARDVASQLSVLAEDRSVSIDARLDGPMIVSADPMMVRQAVTNVLDNAIKFTREGGRVRISSRTLAHDCHLLVDDEGPGIPMEERERVLQRFYRLDGGRDRGVGGAGLGLAIVHWAMTANGGRVGIDENDRGGARVVLALPRRVPGA
jgi:heavy metal sensor kinase